MDYKDQLKDLRKHSNDLARIFYNISTIVDDNKWNMTAEWLEVASGIERISFELAPYDRSYGWCGTADDFSDKRGLLLQSYVTEVGIFNFIWGAFEAVLDAINPPEIPKVRGEVNKACNYIKLNVSYNLPLYLDLLYSLYRAFNKTFGNQTDQIFKLKPYINLSGMALFSVSKVRNRLAHGALHFPELVSIEDVVENYPQVELIQLCSRLVLLSIQMLVLSYYKDSHLMFRVDPEGDIEFGDPSPSDEKVSLELLLRSVHLKGEFEDECQVKFEFQ